LQPGPRELKSSSSPGIPQQTERGKTLDQVKRLQEGVQQKIKDLQAQRAKLPYKNVEEIDQRIAFVSDYGQTTERLSTR
jgi:hypothetical protein